MPSQHSNKTHREKGRALVVFSGGQDSTTCLYWAKERYEQVLALTFSYGQRHSIEIESARRIAEMAGVRHEVLDLGAIFSGLSSLTDSSQAVPEAENASSNQGLPSTFVPGRNIMFLSLAASRAYSYDCDTVVIGVSQEDYAGYPDCREEFVNLMEQTVQAGLDRPIKIESPLLHLSKKQTVELAVGIPGCMEALSHSTTCYNGAVPPCGKCNSCQLRAKGFDQAGVTDPLLERFGASTHAR